MQKDKTMSTSLTETPVFNYLQGQWVYGKYDGHCHLRVAQNVNYTEHLANVRCLRCPTVTFGGNLSQRLMLLGILSQVFLDILNMNL